MNFGPDLIGKTFGRLTVIAKGIGIKNRGTYWVCRCQCGTEKTIRRDSLTTGTRSCGCEQKETVRRINYVHGGAMRGNQDYAYSSWKAMMTRCYDRGHEAYSRYAGRGITVCERWHDFRNFKEDMGDRPDRLTLERVDNDKGYEPGNCEWRTPKAQANNRRDNIVISFNGVSRTVSAWAEALGLTRDVLANRLRNGWSVERALTEPLHTEKRNHRWD